ncbi:MAG: hypothetical protein JXR16_11230 [Bermanella sp.]
MTIGGRTYSVLQGAYKPSANNQTMKTLTIIILAMLTSHAFSHEEPPIVKEWQFIKQDVKKHLFNNEYKKAIESSQKLLSIDPSNDEARLHLLFCYLQSSKRLPEWVVDEVKFSNTDEGHYYQAIFDRLNTAD